jgi:hypothetical protein
MLSGAVTVVTFAIPLSILVTRCIGDGYTAERRIGRIAHKAPGSPQINSSDGAFSWSTNPNRDTTRHRTQVFGWPRMLPAHSSTTS